MTQKEGKAVEQLKNIPDKIYLQTQEEEYPDESVTDFKQLDGVTWCAGRVNESDIEYVRVAPNQTPSPQPGNEGQEWKEAFWSWVHTVESNEATTITLERKLNWIDKHVVTPLQSQLSQAQEEIKRITPTTQSAEEVVTNAYEAGRKFGNAQKDGTPPYNWPASITEYLEQFKNKSK
jgi:hypothetical protein